MNAMERFLKSAPSNRSTMPNPPQIPETTNIRHCVSKIREIVEQGQDDRRSILQLGYNLGRLSELTGLGRGPFWDTWKEAVTSWDLQQLKNLARNLAPWS